MIVAAAIGIAIAIAWGFKALVAYAVVVLAAVIGVAALAAGGDFIRDLSSRRFEDRR